MIRINQRFFFSIQIVLVCIVLIDANSDGQCCRKRIECFECDSRFDPRCGDPFNLTRETGTLIYCDDLCVKLKHKFGSQFYYIRSCADTFKKIYIKKTDVCYTTRTKDGGNLCFCDQELCNTAAPSSLHSIKSITLNALFSMAFRIFVQMFIVVLCSCSLFFWS